MPAAVRSGAAPESDAVPPAVRIVRAGPAQLDELGPLFDAYRRFYGRDSDPAGARRFLEERLNRGESVLFLARLEATPAGFTQLYPLFSSVAMRRVWLLNDLYVAEPARRHGVGAALLAAARDHARASGAGGLTLQTTTDNASAQALYEREGWRRQQGFYWYDLPLD